MANVTANFLERMRVSSRERVEAASAHESIGALLRRAATTPAPLPISLLNFDLIAELKRRSPAQGSLAGQSFEPGQQLDAYAAGGAAAVSVLTEPTEFHGDLAQLEMAAARLRTRGCPVMRKDFLVDPYQVIEARACGASGVLLIAAMLTDAELDELLAAAQEQGLFVLLEAFDKADLERLARVRLNESPQALVGINSRDLRTLAVDFGRFASLASQVRDDVPAVAESGIESPEDIASVARLGYRLALVGSALMRNGRPADRVAELLAAGRDSVGGRAACS